MPTPMVEGFFSAPLLAFGLSPLHPFRPQGKDEGDPTLSPARGISSDGGQRDPDPSLAADEGGYPLPAVPFRPGGAKSHKTSGITLS